MKRQTGFFLSLAGLVAGGAFGILAGYRLSRPPPRPMQGLVDRVARHLVANPPAGRRAAFIPLGGRMEGPYLRGREELYAFDIRVGVAVDVTGLDSGANGRIMHFYYQTLLKEFASSGIALDQGGDAWDLTRTDGEFGLATDGTVWKAVRHSSGRGNMIDLRATLRDFSDDGHQARVRGFPVGPSWAGAYQGKAPQQRILWMIIHVTANGFTSPAALPQWEARKRE